MAAPTFDVWVLDARAAGADARARFARALAEKFSIGEERIQAALASGPFRAKAALDEPSARQLLRALEELGARAVLQPAGAPPPKGLAVRPTVVGPGGPLSAPGAVATAPRAGAAAAGRTADAAGSRSADTAGSRATGAAGSRSAGAAGSPFAGSAPRSSHSAGAAPRDAFELAGDAELRLASLDEARPEAAPSVGDVSGTAGEVPGLAIADLDETTANEPAREAADVARPQEVPGLAIADLDHAPRAELVAAPSADSSLVVGGLVSLDGSAAPPSTPARDAFAPPESHEQALELDGPAAARPRLLAGAPPGAGTSAAFRAVGGSGPSLELAGASGRHVQVRGADVVNMLAGGTLLSASSGEMAQSAPSLQVTKTAPEWVRCKEHKLLFDRASASGCARCGGTMARDVTPQRLLLGGRLRHQPGLRSTLGLALALALGALPARQYAERVKARQAEIYEREVDVQRRPHRYPDPARALEELQDEREHERTRGYSTMALLWLGFAAVAALLFFRFT